MTERPPDTTAAHEQETYADDGLADALERIDAPVGEIRFRDWRIRFVLDEPAGEFVGARKPAEWGFIGNRSENRLDLLARVWEGVPEKFRRILLYHEAQEATLSLGDASDYVTGGPKLGAMDIEDAHRIATRLHHKYAQRLLSPPDYAEYLAWDAEQEHY